MATWQKVGIGLAVVLGIVLMCGFGWLLLTRPGWAANMRDVLIIVLAVESIVVGVGLLLTLWQLYGIVRLLRNEVVPLIQTTKDTVQQLQHTTTFVGQSVAKPIISATGLVAGMRTMANTLRGKDDPYEIVKKE